MGSQPFGHKPAQDFEPLFLRWEPLHNHFEPEKVELNEAAPLRQPAKVRQLPREWHEMAESDAPEIGAPLQLN
jgi:hypothetical protein